MPEYTNPPLGAGLCVRRRRGGGSAPRPSRVGPRRAPPLFTPAGSGPPLPLRARRSACSLKAPAHYSARASAPAGRRTCVFFVFQHALQSVCCDRPLGSPLPCLGPRPARPSLVRRPTALRPRPTRMCAVFPASWRRAAQIHFCRPSPLLARPRPSARARLLSRAHLRPAPQPPSVAAHACLRCIGAAGGAGAQAVRRAQRAGRMLLGRAFAILRMTTERVLFLL